MMRWEILPSARDELQKAIQYYNSIDPSLADEFYGTVVTRRNQARVNPQMYHVRRNEVRRINLGPQFQEWYIAYMLLNEKFVILAIGHGKRRPYYFARRIGEAKRRY